MTAPQDQPTADAEPPVDGSAEGANGPAEQVAAPTIDEPTTLNEPTTTDAPTRLDADAEPQPVDGEPMDAEPKPVDAEPEPVDTEPVDAEPVDAEPEPKPVDAEPKPVDGAPEDAEPEPGDAGAPADAEPARGAEDPTGEEPSDDADGEAPGSRRSLFVGLSLLTVVLVGILVAVLATGGEGSSPSASSPPTSQASSTLPSLPLAAFTSFHDDATSFTMLYPNTWERLKAPVAEMRLIVSPVSGGEVVSVRVSDTEQVTTPENLANIKSVTDGTIASNPTAKILKTDAITLNGMIGYYYLYTFQDAASGLEGVHAHYFLFHGHRMYTIVFQALPTDKFSQFAGLFDQMAQSFKVDPDGPNTPVPTTAAP